MPVVAKVAHGIAPDLVGFGQSGKPDIAYRFEDHARYLDAFVAKMGIGSAYLVAQDWGPALAQSTYPKLLFAADPGALVSPAFAEDFACKLRDCRLVKLGGSVHFLQEDHPETIGRSVADFIAEVEGRRGKSAA